MARSHQLTIVLTCTLMLLAAVATGDEPAQPSLPAAGSWTRYHITVQNDEAQAQSSMSEIRFLDRVTENDQVYIWVEFILWDPSSEMPKYASVIKYLIPEQELLTGTQPIRHSLRYHSREVYEGEVINRERNPDRDLRLGHAMYGPYLQALTCRRTLENIVPAIGHVDYQRGRLTYNQKLRGTTHELEPAERPQLQQSFDVDYEFGMHDDVPTGFVSAKVRDYHTVYFFDPPKDPVVIEDGELSWTLMDFGTGAKSELPEKH